MKKINKIVATALLCLMSVSVMGCKMIAKTPEAIANTTLAKVGGEKVTKGDLDSAFVQYDQMLKQQYGEDYAKNAQMQDQVKEIKKQYLDQLVNQSILLQKASEAGLMPTDSEVKKEYDKEMEQLKENKAQILKLYNFTETQFEEYQKKQVKYQLICDKLFKNVKITDEDIKSYYNENKASKYTQQGEVDFDKSLKEANSIETELKSGSDFVTVAKEKSQDTGSKEKGGDLGFIKYSDTNYLQEFMDGFKNLKEGEISEPIKSKYGYHIIKVTGVTKEGANVAHILVAAKGESTVTPFDSVKDSIKQELETQKKNTLYKEKVDELKKGMKIKTYIDRIE